MKSGLLRKQFETWYASGIVISGLIYLVPPNRCDAKIWKKRNCDKPDEEHNMASITHKPSIQRGERSVKETWDINNIAVATIVKTTESILGNIIQSFTSGVLSHIFLSCRRGKPLRHHFLQWRTKDIVGSSTISVWWFWIILASSLQTLIKCMSMIGELDKCLRWKKHCVIRPFGSKNLRLYKYLEWFKRLKQM